MAPKSKKDQYIDEVKRLYLTEQKSLGEIRILLGPSVQTLSRWLGEEGIDLASRPRNPNAYRTPEEQAEINQRVSEAQRARIEGGGARGGRPKTLQEETRECANPACAAAFQVASTGTQQYCSRTCARTVGNKERWAGERKETVCPCGTTFYSPYPKKYCSDECRAEYQLKRQADPAKWATFRCLNCDEETTKRKSIGNHNKYCSNACAYKHTKTKKHYGVEGLEIVFDSSYEVYFWSLCMMLKLPVERYDRANGVEWKAGCWYAPDFYLPTYEVAVELKGVQDDDDGARWEKFEEQVGKLTILYQKDLMELVKLGTDSGKLMRLVTR